MNKFTNEFKKKAIRLKEEGVHPNKIFKDEGFDLSNKQKDYALKLVNDWRNGKKFNVAIKKDSSELNILKFARNKEIKKKIEYLEAKIAYLEAENDFLANLPKKKKN